MDTSFGDQGKIITDFFDFSDFANSIALLSDNNILVTGQAEKSSSIDGDTDFALVNYHITNSLLDNSFGAQGKVISDLPADNTIINVIVLPDDKILATGTISSPDFSLALYDKDGNLDTSFGSSGQVTTDFFGFNDTAFSSILLPNGKILLAGSAQKESDFNSGDFALALYESDGSLDTSFGNQGKIITDFFGFTDIAVDIALQSDGKILALGVAGKQEGLPFEFELALVRYNNDGSLDPSFGDLTNPGKILIDIPDDSTGESPLFSANSAAAFLSSLAIQTDGKIIVASSLLSSQLDDTDITLFRYNSDGTLDSSFGNQGKVSTDFFGFDDGATDILIQSDGKILVAGGVGQDEQNVSFALVRYNSNGTLDNSFGDQGKVVTDFFGFNELATSMILLPDGRIVVAGQAETSEDSGLFSSPNDFALAIYNSDGSLDTSLANRGKETTDFLGFDDIASNISLQSDGKILLTGFTEKDHFSDNYFSLARYDLNSTDVDLDITSVTAPAIAKASQNIEVSWTVTNQGTEATTADSWFDDVYFSEDEVFDFSDTFLTSNLTFDETPIAAGASYQVTNNFSLPRNLLGDGYLLLMTDVFDDQYETNEANNIQVVPLTVNPVDVDLEITSVTAPTIAEASQNIEVSWTVTNQGTEAATADSWADEVYFSEDEVFDFDDTFLTGDRTFDETPIADGASYQVTDNFSLPGEILGDGYLLFMTDVFDNQYETNEANNIQVVPLTVNPVDVDLEITSVTAPTIAEASQNIEVSWTVTNQGTEATTADSWSDFVYFSEDEVFDFDDTFLTSDRTFDETPIAAGESYQVTNNFSLPGNLLGDGYLLFMTDVFDDQYETNEANNIQVVPLTVNPVDVDLEITSVTAPTIAEASQNIEISWTVTNQGTEATTADSWADEVYFSEDEVFDFFDDTFLTSDRTFDETPIAVGASYQVTYNFSLPGEVLGDGYLLFITDVFDDQYETNEANNIQVVPLTVNPVDVDLEITSVTAPAIATASQNIEVSWTVTNQGTEAATADSWSDYVYFSEDEIFDFDDTFLTNYRTIDETPIAPGASYRVTDNFSLPGEALGDGYLLFMTDVFDDQYETNEANNIQVVAFKFNESPDLSGISFNVVQGSLNAGDSFDVTYNIENQGGEAENFNVDFYISRNNYISKGDYLLETTTINGIGSDSNTGEQTVSLVLPKAGADFWNGDRDYFIAAVIDSENQIEETNEANNGLNTRPIQGTTIDQVSINNTDVPDLSGISFNVVQGSLNAGDSFDVTYNIENQGGEAENFNVDFYISRNNYISKGDYLLETTTINGIGSDSNTGEQTVSLVLPKAGADFWNGDRDYFIAAVIDSENQIEETNEANNGLNTRPIQGTTIDQVRINNIEAININSYLSDINYISSGDELLGSNEDELLGNVSFGEGLEGNSSKQQSLSLSLPNANDDSWNSQELKNNCMATILDVNHLVMKSNDNNDMQGRQIVLWKTIDNVEISLGKCNTNSFALAEAISEPLQLGQTHLNQPRLETSSAS